MTHEFALGEYSYEFRYDKSCITRIKPKIVGEVVEFAESAKFALFVGTPRSGHSIIGAILDSHPLAVVSHELNALEKISQGLDKEGLFSSIIENSRGQALAGRSQSDADHATGYGQQVSGEDDESYAQRSSNLPIPEPYRFDYAVPGQFQGRIGGPIRVIGDKKGGGTAKLLGHDRSLLEKLEGVVEMPVVLIHVIRDPFDNIATMSRRMGTGVREQISRYVWLSEQIDRILGDSEHRRFQIHHEDFIATPDEVIEDLFSWLDLGVERSHVTACSGIVYEKPHRSRELSDWEDDDIRSVEATIERWSFLHRYR